MTAEEPESLREIWQIFSGWLSPRRALRQAREIRVLSALKTTEVWRASRFNAVPIAVLTPLLLTFCAVGATSSITAAGILITMLIILVIEGALVLWYLRWRLIVTADEVIIVKWFRTKHFPLVALDTAYADYWGLNFQLFDTPGSGRLGFTIYTCGHLQTPNWIRWLGKESRADRIGAHVVRRAAVARGEDPAKGNVAEIRRGTGNLFMGFWMAVTAIFR